MRITSALALAAVAALAAGCGGGGGSTMTAAPQQSVSALPLEMTGDWSVKGIGLPNDKLTVALGGQVLVKSPDSNAVKTIGRCDSDGAITLDGSWTSAHKTYEINGSGTINDAHSLRMNASVTADSTPVIQDAAINGDRASERTFDVPPPPPY